MSWWVKNHIAVNDDETKQLCSIEADTQTTLPAEDQTATAGFIIVRGSDALVVDTGDRYILDSGGTWKKQPSGVQLDLTGYATTQDLADGLAGKVDTATYTAGQAAQDTLIAGKQDQLTFDSTPTPDSINPVTSGGVYIDQQRQETEIGAVAAMGAKNLLDYTFSINGNTSARTSNGVTFTINADKSISTSGTASANITSAWIQQNYAVPDDQVILSGCPTGGANNKYRIDILDGSPTSSVVASDYGNGVVIKSSMFTNGTGLIRIRIEKGQNVDGLVFKPMIRRAEITDDTFAPYAPTNRELYEMILALQNRTNVTP